MQTLQMRPRRVGPTVLLFGALLASMIITIVHASVHTKRRSGSGAGFRPVVADRQHQHLLRHVGGGFGGVGGESVYVGQQENGAVSGEGQHHRLEEGGDGAARHGEQKQEEEEEEMERISEMRTAVMTTIAHLNFAVGAAKYSGMSATVAAGGDEAAGRPAKITAEWLELAHIYASFQDENLEAQHAAREIAAAAKKVAASTGAAADGGGGGAEAPKKLAVAAGAARWALQASWLAQSWLGFDFYRTSLEIRSLSAGAGRDATTTARGKVVENANATTAVVSPAEAAAKSNTTGVVAFATAATATTAGVDDDDGLERQILVVSQWTYLALNVAFGAKAQALAWSQAAAAAATQNNDDGGTAVAELQSLRWEGYHMACEYAFESLDNAWFRKAILGLTSVEAQLRADATTASLSALTGYAGMQAVAARAFANESRRRRPRTRGDDVELLPSGSGDDVKEEVDDDGSDGVNANAIDGNDDSASPPVAVAIDWDFMLNVRLEPSCPQGREAVELIWQECYDLDHSASGKNDPFVALGAKHCVLYFRVGGEDYGMDLNPLMIFYKAYHQKRPGQGDVLGEGGDNAMTAEDEPEDNFVRSRAAAAWFRLTGGRQHKNLLELWDVPFVRCATRRAIEHTSTLVKPSVQPNDSPLVELTTTSASDVRKLAYDYLVSHPRFMTVAEAAAFEVPDNDCQTFSSTAYNALVGHGCEGSFCSRYQDIDEIRGEVPRKHFLGLVRKIRAKHLGSEN